MTPSDLTELQTLLDQSQVSTASLTTEDASTAPGTIWTVTAEDLQRYGIQTLAEALNFLSLGMNTEKHLDYSEIGARGVVFAGDYGAHVLLLIDGHAINEQWDGGAYFDRQMGIPLELIDHLEIILGPGSVLYGSNAMLGVINVVTRNGRTIDGGWAAVDSNVPSSLRASLGAGKELDVFGRSTDVVVGAEMYRSTGPRVELGPQPYGLDGVTGEPRRFTDDDVGTGIWGGELTTGRFANVFGAHAKVASGDFTLDLRGSTARRGTPTSVYGNFGDRNNWERDRYASSDLRWRRDLSRVVGLDARLYADHYDYYQQLSTRAAENCLDGQVEGCTYRLAGQARWLGLDTHGTLDWLTNGHLVTVLGADARMRRISSWEDYVEYTSGEAVPTDDYELGENAIGVYLEQTAHPWDTVGLNLGARLDGDERFGTHLSPRAALALLPMKGSVIKVMYSEAFRAPTAFERYYADITYWVEARDLQAEVVRSVEASVEQQFGEQRVLVGVFGARWTDMVSEEELTEAQIADAIASGVLDEDVVTAYQYRNLGSSQNYGVNAAWQGAAIDRRLHFGATVTVADWIAGTAFALDGPGDFAVAPKLFGNVHADLNLGTDLPTVGLACRFVGPRLIDYSDFDPVPKAPTTAEVRGTLSGHVPRVERLTYRLSANVRTSTDTPFPIGPLSGPVPGYDHQETAPVDPFTALAGLAYEF